MKHADLDRLAHTEVRDGVTRQVFTGDGATLAWTTLAPGDDVDDLLEVVRVRAGGVTGRVRFVVGDDEVELGPGGMLVVPPNVEHFAETIGDEPCVDLSIFTPKRDEYAAEESFS